MERCRAVHVYVPCPLCAVADLVEEVEEVAEAGRFLAKGPNCPQFKSCKKCNTVAKSTCTETSHVTGHAVDAGWRWLVSDGACGPTLLWGEP